MGYPYDKTYLEKIQANSAEMEGIKTVYSALLRKYMQDNQVDSDIELTIIDLFTVLGQAFEYGSTTLEGIADPYHFMWDVIDELLPEEPNRTKDGSSVLA